jgi:DNA invertase Pin-like site-specific DNA recombinase
LTRIWGNKRTRPLRLTLAITTKHGSPFGIGVDLFLHQQGLDTSTPSGRAMFQMMGVFAEFERAMIRERVLAGLARAKEQGISLGRRRLENSDAAKVAAIKKALAAKRGVRRIARDLETGVGTILRIKAELAA